MQIRGDVFRTPTRDHHRENSKYAAMELGVTMC